MGRTILMLEHDEDDRYITQSVFDEHQYDIKIVFVGTSQELFTFLETCESTNTPYPSLILLNYYAKPSSGLEVLRELKSGRKFNHIPVIVLSGSIHPDIVRECYASGASSFVQKPSKSLETDKTIANFVSYWFKTVALPQ